LSSLVVAVRGKSEAIDIMAKSASSSGKGALVHRSDVARELNVVPRTVIRWEADEKLGFPRSVTIRLQRYYLRAEIDAWKDALFREGMKAAVDDRRKRAGAEASAQPSDAA
jgi:hypothetical protein